MLCFRLCLADQESLNSRVLYRGHASLIIDYNDLMFYVGASPDLVMVDWGVDSLHPFDSARLRCRDIVCWI